MCMFFVDFFSPQTQNLYSSILQSGGEQHVLSSELVAGCPQGMSRGAPSLKGWQSLCTLRERWTWQQVVPGSV